MKKRERRAHQYSQLSTRIVEGAKDGYTMASQCVCGNMNVWVYDTDSMTGSSYAKCGVCWKVHPFKGAWMDNALGLNFGSWWSQRLAQGFVVK